MALYRKRKAASSSSSSSSSYCGKFPEYGAIFMCSSGTKDECLRRNLFGLPLSSAPFVKAVRSGMILFLFEYERRLLYGVFEAVSDGRLNIVPHAYRSSSSSSSTKSFPAQVRVRLIRDCPPLAEHDFRDAIGDNYYEKFKFNFGLSRQQVQRLMCLFDSKRMGMEKPLVEKKKAKKTRSRPSKDRANLVISSGNLLSVSESKQVTVDEQVKRVDVSTTYSMVLEDYIPLSSPDSCDIEINVKPKSSVKNLNSDASEQRMSVFSRLDSSLQSAAPESKFSSMALEGFSRQFTDSDLLPCFVRQKEKKTSEADHPVNKILEILEEGHDKWKTSSKKGHTEASKRASVFSRLNFS